MGWVGTVHDRCSAAVIAQLLKAGRLVGVRCAGPDGVQAWESAGRPLPVEAHTGRLLCLAGTAEPAPDAIVEIGVGGVRCADPLLWALLSAPTELNVRLGSRHSTIPVSAAADYETLATAVAARIGPWLVGGLASTATAQCEQQEPELPVADTWSRIDWAGEADVITLVVRAFGPPYPGAWTWIDGVRVRVGQARTVDGGGRSLPVPPGTVLRSAPDGLTVAAGRGRLHVSDLSDVVGPVDPAGVGPGSVLGLDLADTVHTLTRRVADLECVVRHLATRTDQNAHRR